jgi:hypothetical protein
VKETEGDRLAEHILNSLCPLNCDPFEDPVINTNKLLRKEGSKQAINIQY